MEFAKEVEKNGVLGSVEASVRVFSQRCESGRELRAKRGEILCRFGHSSYFCFYQVLGREWLKQIRCALPCH